MTTDLKTGSLEKISKFCMNLHRRRGDIAVFPPISKKSPPWKTGTTKNDGDSKPKCRHFGMKPLSRRVFVVVFSYISKQTPPSKRGPQKLEGIQSQKF